MNLLCFLGLHRRDANCQCRRCRKVVHRLRVVGESHEDTGNYETSTEPWLTERAVTVTSRCKRCLAEIQSVRVEWYLG